MTDPIGVDGRPPATAPPALHGVDPPDADTMWTEIAADRRHERFLLRAALLAVIAVSMVIAIRIWG